MKLELVSWSNLECYRRICDTFNTDQPNILVYRETMLSMLDALETLAHGMPDNCPMCDAEDGDPGVNIRVFHNADGSYGTQYLECVDGWHTAYPLARAILGEEE